MRTAVGAVAVLLATGCSVSVGSKEVKKTEVAAQAKTALGKKVGSEPDDVTCEDDLKAEVGATVRCTVTSGGAKLGMTATAKSVDGDKVDMDFKVDDAPGAGGSADLQPSDSARPTYAPSSDAPSSDAPSTGAQSVSRAEVARQGKAALAAQVGREPDAFTCPTDLPARVGAQIRCQLADGGKQYGVTVTATSVVGGQVKMDFKVDTTPKD
ncbi:DUF4333 domain-containing protein [Streptomyces sp. ITFR-16]|uniref:DUF4333 domain-containing protein n=1 Tax=Streptomyces sp. ITFR-16 TaxID=3075198 RepID=UPI00288A12E2|nr:DUF4333 domain-containing protein [Streptomyces sp. ITFR-16]WNI24227.1 DUF4333 domain-containing protein [Streptomyces sp. ITFR-16]